MAHPKQIWEQLMDFKGYPNWNPFISEAQGEIKPGHLLKIKAGGMNFKPTVLEVNVNKKLRWLGKLWTKWLFSGEHIFHIEPMGDKHCIFKHEERFSGILVPLFAKKLKTDTKQGFEEMNQALKRRVEG